MDLTIPGGMGGEEAVKKLLAVDPKAKVIISSGHVGKPIMSNYKDHGFAGAIAKPYYCSRAWRSFAQGNHGRNKFPGLRLLRELLE